MAALAQTGGEDLRYKSQAEGTSVATTTLAIRANFLTMHGSKFARNFKIQ
jgi:hypothetical protein